MQQASGVWQQPTHNETATSVHVHLHIKYYTLTQIQQTVY